MIYCVIDPDLFLGTYEASTSIKMHLTKLYEMDDALILMSNDYREVLLESLNKPELRGYAHSVYKRLNESDPKKLRFLIANQELDSNEILYLDQLLLNSDCKDLWLMVISQIISCALRTLPLQESEIVLTSWEKEHVINYYDRPRKWLKQRLLWHLQLNDESKALIIYTSRNWVVRWTVRYSDELPSELDENIGRYPFIPPVDWKDCPDDAVLSVRNGRRGWVDSRNWVWAQPDPSLRVGQNHWDVQLPNGSPISHLNVNKYGCGEPPGDINH